MTVASSSQRSGVPPEVPWTSSRAPEVRPSPIPKTSRPSKWWRAAWLLPWMPNVKRRFAAVLATAVVSNARKLASCGSMIPRQSRKITR